MIETEAAAKNKHARVAVNLPQAVIRAAFGDMLPQEQLIEEDANEGEKD